MFTKDHFDRLRRIGDVLALSPLDYEWFGKFLLESMGYQSVTVSQKFGELGGDGGIDLTCVKDNQRYLVQCKKWKYGFNGSLPIAVVRELGGCMLRDRVPRGIVLATLPFDNLCRHEAQKMGIVLLSNAEVITHMKTFKPNFDAKPPLIFRIWRAIIQGLGFVFIAPVTRRRKRRQRR